MKHLLLATLMVFSLKADIFHIHSKGFYFPDDKPITMLFDTEKGFIAFRDNMIQFIPAYNCSQELRNVTMEDIQNLLEHGYIMTTETDNGQLRLEYRCRLKGGGPVTAGWLYWATKSFCYGSLLGAAATGATAIVASTGGTAAIPMATALAAAKTAIIGGSMGVAATAVATTVTTTTVGATLGTVAVGTASSIGSAWGIIAAVETASLSAAAFGAWLPLP